MERTYLVRNRWLLAYLKSCDALLPRARPVALKSPQRILLTNLAHMGDVAVATSVLRPLRTRFPDAEIGFLIGSWSRDVLKGHPLVDKIHILDHWKHNRTRNSVIKKVLHDRGTRKKALKEIRELGYDWAVDLYPYFGNAIPLLYRARIPVRWGYASGGYGPLLTLRKEWEKSGGSIACHHGELLGVNEKLKPELVAKPCTLPEEYAVLHIGTGASEREQPLSLWKRVVEFFAAKKYPLFLTGKGKREKEQIQEIIAHAGYGSDLCDKLDWQELVFVVGKASLLLSVETCVMHIASSTGTPNLLFAKGIDPLWMPDNPFCILADENSPESALKMIQEFIV